MPDRRPIGINPYDFRAPVREPHLLAGRKQAKEQIDAFLREAAAGRPVHFSLFGVPGSGKSSLLNTALSNASERRLLPIKLVLREATVESEAAFYAALFESGLQALIERNAIAADGDFMKAWLRLTRTGMLDVTYEFEPLEMSLVLAAHVKGQMAGSIQVPSLIRDISWLLALAGDLKGVAVCIDAAERLDDNRDIAESLLELVDADPRIVLVTAAHQAGRLQAIASRTWAQIEVGPFSAPQEVFEAMTKPLERFDTSAINLAPVAAEDIYTLTRGQPYEINLVCHFIWEALQQGEQSEFALSDAVIERVLAEFIERGRHESSKDIPLVVALTHRHYELLARVAPYEQLTIKEVALTRLMLSNYSDEQLAELEQEIRNDLHILAEQRILTIQEDRFCLTVSDDARLYIRYAAERHTGKRIEYGETYTQYVTKACREELSRALAGEDHKAAHMIAVWRPYEVGASQAGLLLTELSEAVAAGAIGTIASVIKVPLDLSAFAEHRKQGIILYSFVIRFGLQEIEHATLALNVNDLDNEELESRADGWLEENRDLLSRFGIAVLQLRCELVSPALADAVVAYAYIELFQSLAMSLYTARRIDAAKDLLSSSLGLAETLVASEPTDPVLRTRMADAKNRVGFMLASGEKWQEALEAFEQSEQLDPEQQWVTMYNIAYVKARMGSLDDAVISAEAAGAALTQCDDMILHADFPTIRGWEPKRPWFNVVNLSGGWVEKFVKLQTAVWSAQREGGDRERLDCELDELSLSAPAAVLGLAGWAELTIRSDRARGIELLELAADACELHEVELARREIATLREGS